MTALYPIHVPNTDLYVYGLDAADMPHGLIVTNAPLFHEFVKSIVEAKTAEIVTVGNSMARNAARLLKEYEALVAAYEKETGRKWEYEEGEQ